MKFRVKYPGLLVFSGWVAVFAIWIDLGIWSFHKFHIHGIFEIVGWFTVFNAVAGIIGVIIIFLVSLCVED